MVGRVIAVLFAVGLAIGVWLLWPRADPPDSPNTTLPVAEPTTTVVTEPPPTTTTSTTLARDGDSRVVETVEEAEAILRELWFGWFEGIYNQDEDRIKEVVATEEQVQLGVDQFGQMAFSQPPTPGALAFADTEILRSDADCISVWSTVSADFREGSSEGVRVIRRLNDTWVFISYWAFKEDLWEADCEAQLDS